MFLMTQYVFKIIKLLLDGKTAHPGLLVGGVDFLNFITDHQHLDKYVNCH